VPNLRTVAMLNALGVTPYRRTKRIVAAPESVPSTLARSVAQNAANQAASGYPTTAFAHATREGVFSEHRVERASRAEPSLSPAVPSSMVRGPVKVRDASVRSELVLPAAELERFLDSRMYRHLCLLLAQGEAIPVVENAVQSDTAVHFEAPPKSALKLGSMALLRSAWRAKRQAWLAIRLWRKR
jgi:hypothetical protein